VAGNDSQCRRFLRAADRSQIAALLSDRDPAEIFGDSLVAWYDPIGEPTLSRSRGSKRSARAGERRRYAPDPAETTEVYNRAHDAPRPDPVSAG